jgi:nifR3 family TIM-barrel protein
MAEDQSAAAACARERDRESGEPCELADPADPREIGEAGTIGNLGAARANARFSSTLNAHVAPAAPGEFKELRLGRLRVSPPVVLAPMAGVTNYAFRSLCREFGAGLYVSEMITARGYLNGNRLTCLLASSRADEKPRSVQIYGSDPVDIGEMAKSLVDDGVDHLDMNFGCPVPKVTRHGGGSAIPVKPRLLARLVHAAVRSAGDVPVTIKVRTGIDREIATFLDAGRVAEQEGAAAIGLHARTAAQLYAGDARWDAIGELKQSVSIPVLGNGDVWECWDALRMMRATGCDGVIVGRGCLGRPWLFAELAHVFAGREPPPPPGLGAIVAIMHDHARRLIDFFGEEHGMRQMRKWCGWYTKGFRGSAVVRERLSRVARLQDMSEALATLDASEPFPIAALRASRGKSGREQSVSLPHGYLAERDDDTPPRSPHSPEEIEAWERALGGG